MRGSLTLARGNQQALAAERRYIKHNLNRMYREDYGPEIDKTSYEFKRAQELKSILHDCDYFFDLHSAPIAQAPFIVAEQGSVGLFAKLGIPRIMTGWSKFSAGAIGGDGENYANTHGAKAAATLESGSHFDKRSNDVAYQAVISFLVLLEMIAGPEVKPASPLEIVDVYKVVLKEFDDFRYAGDGGQLPVLRQGAALRVSKRPPADGQRGHLSPHTDEAGGHADSRGSLLSRPTRLGCVTGSEDRKP